MHLHRHTVVFGGRKFIQKVLKVILKLTGNTHFCLVSISKLSASIDSYRLVSRQEKMKGNDLVYWFLTT